MGYQDVIEADTSFRRNVLTGICGSRAWGHQSDQKNVIETPDFHADKEAEKALACIHPAQWDRAAKNFLYQGQQQSRIGVCRAARQE
jgi:hypothetical protein